MKKLIFVLLIINSIINASDYVQDNRDKGFEQECKNEVDHFSAENIFYSGKMYGMLSMMTYITPKQDRNSKIKGYSKSNIIRIICEQTLNDKHGNTQYGFFSNFQWHVVKMVRAQ
jgi:hypothetical protein